MDVKETAMDRTIRNTLDGRGIKRIQMQIPLFGESRIIFFQCINDPLNSSLWANLLTFIVDEDFKNPRSRGALFFDQKSEDKRRETWSQGLVALPVKFNIANVSTAQRALRRLIRDPDRKQSEAETIAEDTLDETLNAHIDSIRTYDRVHNARLKTSIRAPQLAWEGPTHLPPGSIIVWHGFHTTSGDKGSSVPDATVFLDYTERDTLNDSQRDLYLRNIMRGPYDAGAGSINTRSARPNIEYNSAKGIPHRVIPHGSVLPTLMGGESTRPQVCGLLQHVDIDTLMRRGFAVIVPVYDVTEANWNLIADCKSKGYGVWTMSKEEFDEYTSIMSGTVIEFENFLTYMLFDREMLFLTRWLSVHGPEPLRTHFTDLWETVFNQPFIEFWDGEVFKYQHIKLMVQNFIRDNEQKVNEIIRFMDTKSVHTKSSTVAKPRLAYPHEENLEPAHFVLYQLRAWFMLAENGLSLKLSPVAQTPKQNKCWKTIFGDGSISQTKLAWENFGQRYLMYWREGMGNQKNGMATGETLDSLKHYFIGKISPGTDHMFSHRHRRGAQGGGIKIAADSGMGGATSLFTGQHHVELQTGKFGTTLAHKFYKNPLVVFERFRVKTHGTWGLGHVDHSIRSRLDYPF
jgi:hypothetical protein